MPLSDYPGPFLDGQAIHAAIERDIDAVHEALDQMLPGERGALARACDLLAATIRTRYVPTARGES